MFATSKLPEIPFRPDRELGCFQFNGSSRPPMFQHERVTERWIYFAQGDDGGPVKIGVTLNDPRVRIDKLQTGYPFGRLRLVGLLRGSTLTEHLIHGRFKRLRMCGEWFAPSPELLEFVRLLDLKTFSHPEFC